MPVSPWRFRMGRMGDVLMSAAGPAMNLLLAAVALTALGIWQAKGPMQQPIQQNVEVFLSTGGWMNLFLAIFNMLPFPPLDGSRVAAGLVAPLRPVIESPQVQQFGWLAIFACSMLGLFGPVMRVCHALADAWSDRVFAWFA